MLSHHAPALQAHTTPYSRTIGTNSQPVRAASASSCPTPMRATRYANTAEPQRNSSSCSLRVTRRPRSLPWFRSEEHTSELQSQSNLVCRLLLEKKKNYTKRTPMRRTINKVKTTLDT